jgi:hypothetical protein
LIDSLRIKAIALRAGQGVLVLCGFLGTAHAATQPWWQHETAMTASAKLSFVDKPWWPKAKALKEGERFTLDLNGDGRADTVVTRVDGDIIEAIDDTGHASDIWNKISTTYVVSYNGTGTVDRMVSYIDEGHTGHASEVEIRYFRDGYLRYAWFARSYGGDAAKIFALKRWQYAGNDHGSEFRGNSQIYLNKYDRAHNAWTPLSECPFSFWDIDNDGRTDVTLRVSSAPRGSLHGPDTDYANNYDYMWAENATPLNEAGALNMRLSFNIDAKPRLDPLDKPHSNFSFTLVGDQPYVYVGMRDFNPMRREPQTTIHMPWQMKWQAALDYPATATGFSWDEARSNFRWEGQFWIYERDYLSNTGSPTQRWNMRRELSASPSARRELYFSAADERFHLRGAQEAWMEVGHLVSDQKDLEFRWWDTDGDGYLDTVEVYRGNATVPSRVAHFAPHAAAAPLTPDALAASYNKVLLQSIATDLAVIEPLKSIARDATAEKYEEAAKAADSMERKRYCLDVARELYYLRVRDRMLAQESASLYSSESVDAKRFRDPSAGDAAVGYTLGDSIKFWSAARVLRKLDDEYAAGDFKQFSSTLAQVHFDPRRDAEAN